MGSHLADFRQLLAVRQGCVSIIRDAQTAVTGQQLFVHMGMSISTPCGAAHATENAGHELIEPLRAAGVFDNMCKIMQLELKS